MEFLVHGPASGHGSAGLPRISIILVAASGRLGNPAFQHTEKDDA